MICAASIDRWVSRYSSRSESKLLLLGLFLLGLESFGDDLGPETLSVKHRQYDVRG